MRNLIPVVLCSIILSAWGQNAIRVSPPDAIDLDKPGALEALRRDNPKHFEEVMKQVDEVQTVRFADNPVHDLGLLLRPSPFGQSGDLKLSYPAKSRLIVIVDGTTYLITVRYTKDPARMVPAR